MLASIGTCGVFSLPFHRFSVLRPCMLRRRLQLCVYDVYDPAKVYESVRHVFIATKPLRNVYFCVVFFLLSCAEGYLKVCFCGCFCVRKEDLVSIKCMN